MAGFLTSEIGDAATGFTYGEMLDYLGCRFSNETDKYRNLMRVVFKEILWDIMSRAEWDWLRSAANFDTIKNTTEYSLETDVQFVRGDMIIPGISILQRKHLTQVRGVLAQPMAQAGGIPTMYAMTGRDSVLIAPNPGAVYTVEYDYTRYLTDPEQQMLDTDYPPLPTSDRHVLLQGGEMKLRMDDDRFDVGTKISNARYEQLMYNMIWREKAPNKVTAEPESPPPSAFGYGYYNQSAYD
jgi:hypothetical protein